jgi:hypothetical protein
VWPLSLRRLGRGSRAGDEDTREAVIAVPGLETALAAQFGSVGVSLNADGGVVRESAGLSLLRNATWVCSNVFRHLRAERVLDFRGLLRLMTAGLRSTDLDVRVDSCWALSYAADLEGGVELLLETVSRAKNMVRQSRVASAQSRSACAQCALMEPLVACLEDPSAALVTPALRLCGTIVSGACWCGRPCAFAR